MKSVFKLKFKTGIVAALVIVAVFTGGFLYGRSQVNSIYEVEGLDNKTLGQPDGVDFSIFWDAWRSIEEEYVERNELDRQQMVWGAISGMINSLGDPYTVFFEPQESKVFQEDVSGKFEGIGAEIGIREEVLTVISPLKNSPAERSGLRAGDKILKINDKSTEGMNLPQAVQNIRGQKGTTVTLTIARNNDIREIGIVRDRIVIPVVQWERLEGGVVHLELFSFSEEAPRAFRQALLEIESSSPSNKIIIDLRNNPGGFLEVAQEIMGWFVEAGEVVAIEDFGNGRGQREYRAIGSGSFKNRELIVLINEGTASAAEIMAGALRDLKDVKLVGAKSFGKGSIQHLEDLRGGSSLKITVAKWLTPSGKSIDKEGLEPDVAVELTEEDFEAGRDPQLDRAVELIK